MWGRLRKEEVQGCMQTVLQNYPSTPNPSQTQKLNLFKINTVSQNCKDLTQVSENPTQISQIFLNNKKKSKHKIHLRNNTKSIKATTTLHNEKETFKCPYKENVHMLKYII